MQQKPVLPYAEHKLKLKTASAFSAFRRNTKEYISCDTQRLAGSRRKNLHKYRAQVSPFEQDVIGQVDHMQCAVKLLHAVDRAHSHHARQTPGSLWATGHEPGLCCLDGFLRAKVSH